MISASATRRVVLATTALSCGGVWRHVEDLGVGLRERGVEVTLGLLPAAVALQTAAAAAQLPWEPLDRSVRRRDVTWHVHLHDTYDRRALGALAVRRISGGPSVVTEHLPHNHASDEALEPQNPRRPYAAQLKTAFKRFEFSIADVVIAVSRSSQRFLSERYSLPEPRFTVVHNGIDVSALPVSVSRERRGPMRVVAVGSLGRQKGHDVLVEAVSRATQDWTVTIVGSGSQLERLRSRAASLAEGRVTLAGWLDDPLPEVLAADVMCMPSRWEAFPYAALEAGALRRAVVASRVDGLEEIVVDGQTGVLVEPDDPAGLAAALDDLAADGDKARRFGLAAHDRVAALFTLPNMIDGTLAAYEDAQHMPLRSTRRGRRVAA